MIKLFLFSLIILGNSCSDNSEYLVTIETEYGDMKLILYDETPLHKENFLALAQAGEYDSTIFHRVIKGFMIQGGDVAKDNPEKFLENNDKTIPAEFVPKYHHKKGALAAARQPDQFNPDKASSWCQFYIVHGNKFSKERLAINQQQFTRYIREYLSLDEQAELREELQTLYSSGDMEAYEDKAYGLVPVLEKYYGVTLTREYPENRLKDYETIGGAPHLDDDYTVFGEVIDGFAVIDSIASQPVAGANKPRADIYMKVSVEEVKKKKITQQYGYVFPE